MRIVMTLLVRDEEDILDAHLRFHLAQGVDFVIATDNLSTDSTPSILQRYEKAGKVRVIQETDDTYSQAIWVTRMARMAYEEHGADWVIHSDVDEFWWPKRGDLGSTLAAIPNGSGVLRASRVNFLPRRDEDGEFFERMTFRDVISHNSLGDPLPPKICHRGCADADVAQGNHAVRGTGLGEIEPREPLVILHFPLRTYAQFERKISLGGRAYLNNDQLPEAIGKTWRQLYQTYLAGDLSGFYESQTPDESAIEEGIRAGRWIRDRRLQRFFEHEQQD